MDNSIDDVLQRMAHVLRRYVAHQEHSESHLARLVGVTHPTIGRMLYPERQGGDGVAIRNWLHALQLTGHLQPLVQGIERSVHERTSGQGMEEFVAFDNSPVNLTGGHTEPMNTEDEARIETSLLRIGHALRAALPASPTKSARQLAMKIGVAQPTLASLLSPSGDHAGGTAIRHFLVVSKVLGLGDVIVRLLPQTQPRHRPRRDDQAVSPSVVMG